MLQNPHRKTRNLKESRRFSVAIKCRPSHSRPWHFEQSSQRPGVVGRPDQGWILQKDTPRTPARGVRKKNGIPRWILVGPWGNFNWQIESQFIALRIKNVVSEDTLQKRGGWLDDGRRESWAKIPHWCWNFRNRQYWLQMLVKQEWYQQWTPWACIRRKGIPSHGSLSLHVEESRNDFTNPT